MQRRIQALPPNDCYCRSRYLSHEYKKIIGQIIQRNFYFAHRENAILAKITDQQPHIQELGFRRVVKARVFKQSGQIRKFKVCAKLNFDAAEYFEIIEWTDVVITEPPVIQVTPTVFFSKLSCHI